MSPDTADPKRLVLKDEARDLLHIDGAMIDEWIENDRVRRVEGADGSHLIPLSDLLSALGGTFDPAEVVESITKRQPIDDD